MQLKFKLYSLDSLLLWSKITQYSTPGWTFSSFPHTVSHHVWLSFSYFVSQKLTSIVEPRNNLLSSKFLSLTKIIKLKIVDYRPKRLWSFTKSYTWVGCISSLVYFTSVDVSMLPPTISWLGNTALCLWHPYLPDKGQIFFASRWVKYE